MKEDLPTMAENAHNHRIKYPDGQFDRQRQNTWWYRFIRPKCKHKWQPLSFVFETQLLDKDGRVLIRQPDLAESKVFCVCMKCFSHTYVKTAWVGFNIGSPDILEEYDKYPEGYPENHFENGKIIKHKYENL